VCVTTSLEIRLVEATSEDDIENVRLVLKPDEIWQALAYPSWPACDDWQTSFLERIRAAFFIVHRSGGTIGVLLNGLSRFADWGYVEFVVAITDHRYRRRGFGWQTLGLGMDFWFARGANVCWCTYSKMNPGSLGMAKRIKSPKMSSGPTVLQCVDGVHPAGAGAFTRAQWEEAKREIGWVG